MSKIAVIYYSATGHVHDLAEAIAAGASDAGAEVRLRRVSELSPDDAFRGRSRRHESYEAARELVKKATVDDLDWADGFALGTPTRYGLLAAELKAFIDQTGPLWNAGRLSNKVATSFTSSANSHGGQESTLLALNNVFYHWGSLIVPPGYTHELLYAAGGNPYGASFSSGSTDGRPGIVDTGAVASGLRDGNGNGSPLAWRDGQHPVSTEALTAAHYQGHRLAQYARLLVEHARPVATGHPLARSKGPLALDPYDPPAASRFRWQSWAASP